MSSYPLLDVFWTMLWFFLLIMWFFLVGWIFLDILRNRDIGGWGKAGWALLVILVPLIGVLVYVAFQGVGRRESAGARRSGGEPSGATRATGAFDLSALADLHDRGVLSDAEYQREKEKILH